MSRHVSSEIGKVQPSKPALFEHDINLFVDLVGNLGDVCAGGPKQAKTKKMSKRQQTGARTTLSLYYPAATKPTTNIGANLETRQFVVSGLQPRTSQNNKARLARDGFQKWLSILLVLSRECENAPRDSL